MSAIQFMPEVDPRDVRTAGRSVRLLKVVDIVTESDDVASLWLSAVDGEPMLPPIAGQFLPIGIAVEGRGDCWRSYTVSGYEPGMYRLSVKRERRSGMPAGLVSNLIHDQWKVGTQIMARQPTGSFVFDWDSTRPAVFLAGGIGVTPFVAMLRDLALVDRHRKVTLIYGVRGPGDFPFRAEIDALALAMPNLRVLVRFSRVDSIENEDPNTFSVGRVDKALVLANIADADTDVYACGPGEFMEEMRRIVSSIGVPETQFQHEAFVPAAINHGRGASTSVAAQVVRAEMSVTFARSGVVVRFGNSALNLLELAEDAGIDVPFSCRSGTCGTCACRLEKGEVEYTALPTAAVGADEVLLCCALPNGDVELDI